MSQVIMRIVKAGTLLLVLVAAVGAGSPSSRPIEIPAQLLDRYNPTTRMLQLVDSHDASTRQVAIPPYIELIPIADTAIVKSFFYFVVNDTLRGLPADYVMAGDTLRGPPTDSVVILRQRIQKSSTIKVALRARSDVRAVAGFYFFDLQR